MNLPDEVIESITSKTHDVDATNDDVVSQSGSESSKDSVDPILKWIEKKELFIALERTEDAQQTEQALAVLPMKVRKLKIGPSFWTRKSMLFGEF